MSNPAIHKYEQEWYFCVCAYVCVCVVAGGYRSQEFITGAFIMVQLHRSHYGGMESKDPLLIPVLSNMRSDLHDEN